MSKRIQERRVLAKWKALAPRVHAHFLRSFESKEYALQAARERPVGALMCYRAIVASFSDKLG